MEEIKRDGVQLTQNEYKLYKNFWILQKVLVHPHSIFGKAEIDIEDYLEQEDSDMSFCEDETNPSGEKNTTKVRLKDSSDRESGAIAEDEFMEPGVLKTDELNEDTFVQS